MKRLNKLLLLSSSMISIALLNAYANDECGIIVEGGTVTCFSGSYTKIIYGVKNATLILENGVEVIDSDKGVIVGGGDDFGNVKAVAKKGSSVTLKDLPGTYRGVSALTNTGNSTIHSEADIDTSAAARNYAHGIYGYVGHYTSVSEEGGDIEIKATGGDIKTSTNGSDGIHARSDAGTSGNIDITSEAVINTGGKYARGIRGRSLGANEGNVNITAYSLITTTGEDSVGIEAQTKASLEGDINIVSAANIETSGAEGYGIKATVEEAGNPGSIYIKNTAEGNITTSGLGANGMKLAISGTGAAETSITAINDGTIETLSSDAEGMLAKTDITGKGDIYMENNGSIKGSYDGSDGILANTASAENTGDIHIVNNGTIETKAREPFEIFGTLYFPTYAHGISVIGEGSGNIQVDVNNTITTNLGNRSSGINVNLIQGNNVLINANADILSGGWDGDGIRVEQQIGGRDGATAVINVNNGATVKGTGVIGADGIQAYLDGNNGGTYDINIVDGTIIGGQDGNYTSPLSGTEYQYYGAAIQISAPRDNVLQLNEVGGPDGMIDLSASSVLDGSLSGTAIRDSDGDMILTTEGKIIGDILAQNGSDIVHFKGGTIEGTVDGGDDWLSRTDGYSDLFNIIGYNGNASDLPIYINFEDVTVTKGSNLDFGDSYIAPQAITYTVDDQSTIIMTGAGVGDYMLDAGVENNGLFDFVDGAVGDHLNIIGNGTPTAKASAIGDLSGSGAYKFDTDFAALKSDYITVNGNITANGTIEINSATKSAVENKGEILLIEAPNDADKSDESFILATTNQYQNNLNLGLFTNSPFVWELRTSNNDWVLAYAQDPRQPASPSPTRVLTSDIPAYAALPTLGREIAMNELDTLHQRLGELRNNQGWVGSGSSNLKTHLGTSWHNMIEFDENKVNAWLRGTLSSIDFGADSGFDLSGTYGGFNLGIDKKFELSPRWNIYAGLFGGYKMGDFESDGKSSRINALGGANIDIDTWSIGAYATFFNRSGTYIDLVAEYLDLSADVNANHNLSLDGYALAGSVEVGHSFDLADNWIIEPQAQLKLAHISWDDFKSGETEVEINNHTYVTGRLGARVEKNIETMKGEIKPWIYLGVLHEFTDAPNIYYGTTNNGIFEAQSYDTAGEIRIGLTADYNKNIQLYGDFGYTTDFKDYNMWRGDIGVRVKW